MKGSLILFFSFCFIFPVLGLVSNPIPGDLIFLFQHSIRRTVYDNETGQPMPGTKTALIELGMVTYTELEGNFEFNGIPLNRFTLFVECDEYLAQELSVGDQILYLILVTNRATRIENYTAYFVDTGCNDKSNEPNPDQIEETPEMISLHQF